MGIAMRDKELDKLAADLGKYDKKGIYGQYNFEIWKGDINIPDWLNEEDKNGNRFEEMEARISDAINWLNKKIEKYAWVDNSRRAGKDGNWIGIESKWDVVSEIKSGSFDEADAVHIKEIAEDTIDELKEIGNLVKKAGVRLVRILESDGFWSDRLPHMASIEESKMVDKIMMTERVARRVTAKVSREYMEIANDVVGDIAEDAIDSQEGINSVHVEADTSRGRVEASGIISYSYLEGGGFSPPGDSSFEAKYRKRVDGFIDGQWERFRKQYPQVSGTGYVTEEQAEEADLYSEWEEWDNAALDDEIILLDAGVLFLDDNRARAYAGAFLQDGQGRYDWFVNEDFEFSDENDFQKQLERNLKKVVSKI